MNKQERREYNQLYYQKHKDRIKDQAKKWKEENYEKAKGLVRRWMKANREYRREYTREWARNHPESNNMSILKWNHANVEKVRAHRIAQKNVKLESVCEMCGGIAKHRHHPDYNKPLNVVHLCPACHRSIHYQEIALA